MLRSRPPRRAHLRHANRSAVGSVGPSEPHWIDVWLPRLSHIAQFGLFVFTLGSIYYTVIPLYQKALLEEAIAKKETDLASLTKTLEASYVRIRSYAVREFSIAAAPKCSGLLQAPEKPVLLGARAEPRKPRAENVYSIDVPTCLREAASRTSTLSELKPEDKRTFSEAVERLGVELLERRQKSLESYRAASSKITDEDIKALPPESFRVQHLKFLERIPGRVVSRQEWRELAAQTAQEKVGAEYEQAIRDGLVALRKIPWSKETQSAP
jgi:hypothetical protein